MKLSCCINTYKRPLLLENLLDCLTKQKLSKDWHLEVIVVDNSELKEGKSIVKKFQNDHKLDIHYFVQSVKNISLTRNKAVKEASGDLILFIDDDGIPVETWIYDMVNCLIKYKADGVFGTVLPYFDDNVPTWTKSSPFFKRLIQSSGEDSIFFRTGNCLVKSHWLKREKGPFDPKFGLTGGEDSDLFERIKKSGAKLIFCKEAIVYDYVPTDRANLSWLIKRFYRTGITFVTGSINSSKIPILKRAYYLVRSVILLILCFILFLFTFPFRKYRYFWPVKISSYTGHLMGTFNVRYEGYKTSN